MSKPLLMAAAILSFAMAPAASAQDVERYRLEKTDDGYVRMDTVTGQMSICEERNAQLVCKLAAEERGAYEDRLDEMLGKIEALEERVAKLEGSSPTAGLPSEEEFEQSLGYMERFFRRFMDIVKDFGTETREGGGTAEPTPDRT
ncbi:hypothetical protein [Aquamicrobium sp. LC103]|uniref:hypothetical protein n=1 Tax=Aquamicrobium sp. LC103 TaxID=1120658 RepID=UPI00063ECB5F|nr:hypothetical protein [Aquamicrobium sp. LC103]TKT74202.1 hypothetical protein XW59_024630 [Aquamicrobium sp. LC103]